MTGNNNSNPNPAQELVKMIEEHNHLFNMVMDEKLWLMDTIHRLTPHGSSLADEWARANTPDSDALLGAHERLEELNRAAKERIEAIAKKMKEFEITEGKVKMPQPKI